MCKVVVGEKVMLKIKHKHKTIDEHDAEILICDFSNFPPSTQNQNSVY